MANDREHKASSPWYGCVLLHALSVGYVLHLLLFLCVIEFVHVARVDSVCFFRGWASMGIVTLFVGCGLLCMSDPF